VYTADEVYGQLIGGRQPTNTPVPDHAPGPERVIRTIPTSTGLRDNPLLFLFVLAAIAVLLLRFNVHGDVSVGVSG
jgi:hypothetical protein